MLHILFSVCVDSEDVGNTVHAHLHTAVITKYPAVVKMCTVTYLYHYRCARYIGHNLRVVVSLCLSLGSKKFTHFVQNYDGLFLQ